MVLSILIWMVDKEMLTRNGRKPSRAGGGLPLHYGLSPWGLFLGRRGLITSAHGVRRR